MCPFPWNADTEICNKQADKQLGISTGWMLQKENRAAINNASNCTKKGG